MHPAIDTIPDVDQRLSAGLTVLGFVGGAAALFAVLAMWTLLTSPDRVASAAPGGLPAIFKVVLAVVFEAARPLVAWL
jgi:CDP-diglyceride synthetase